MRTIIFCLLTLSISAICFSQVTDSIIVPESQTLDLQFLVAEALMNNPDIQASLHQMDVMGAKVPQAGSLDDTELKFMSEGMPGFNFSQAMFHRLELIQRFRFPTKLSA